MNYKIISSNGSVKVIEFEDKLIQLSADIDVDQYLADNCKTTAILENKPVKAKAEKFSENSDKKLNIPLQS